MKVVKYFFVVMLFSILISCPNYNSSLDPEAEDYQGWPLLGEGEEEVLWTLSGISPENSDVIYDFTPLLDWPDMINADRYEIQWAFSTSDLPSSTIYYVMDSEYQILTELSWRNEIFWRIKIINITGETSGWSVNFSFKEREPVIGDIYGGGIVFYLDGFGTGLIASESDQSAGVDWSNGSYTTTGATATGIGSGSINTSTIVLNQGDGIYAAKLCYDLVLNGYTDWFLPSVDELWQMKEQRYIIGGFVNSFDGNYWSSSERDSTGASYYKFVDFGYQYFDTKTNNYRVRAIRAFYY